LPSLPEPQRKAIAQQLSATALSPRARRQILAMLEAASNPDAEAPDVVIQALEPERRDNILGTIDVLNRFTGGLASRGTRGVLDISDDEFNALVDEANGSNE
jgi:hypothetical protein